MIFLTFYGPFVPHFQDRHHTRPLFYNWIFSYSMSVLLLFQCLITLKRNGLPSPRFSKTRQIDGNDIVAGSSQCGDGGDLGNPGLGRERRSVQQEHCLVAHPCHLWWWRGSLEEGGHLGDDKLLLHHLHLLGKLLQVIWQVRLSQVHWLPVYIIFCLLNTFSLYSTSDSFGDVNLFNSRPANSCWRFVQLVDFEAQRTELGTVESCDKLCRANPRKTKQRHG